MTRRDAVLSTAATRREREQPGDPRVVRSTAVTSSPPRARITSARRALFGAQHDRVAPLPAILDGERHRRRSLAPRHAGAVGTLPRRPLVTAPLDIWVAVDVRYPAQWVQVRAADYLSAREAARRQLRCSLEHVLHHVVAEGESISDARQRLVRRVEAGRQAAPADTPVAPVAESRVSRGRGKRA